MKDEKFSDPDVQLLFNLIKKESDKKAAIQKDFTDKTKKILKAIEDKIQSLKQNS